MRECGEGGLTATGTLSGKLHVQRRTRLLAEVLDPDARLVHWP
jgi:L-serine deaminase